MERKGDTSSKLVNIHAVNFSNWRVSIRTWRANNEYQELYIEQEPQEIRTAFVTAVPKYTATGKTVHEDDTSSHVRCAIWIALKNSH
jgi:hypothetical protein